MREFRYAWKRALPILLTYFFLATGFGIMLQQAGLGAGWAAFASIFIYSGAISPTIRTLGATLPFAIMAVLVVYCLKSIPTGSLKENLELIAAVLLVAGLHLTKKNTVLSISVGTVFYMVLVHVV